MLGFIAFGLVVGWLARFFKRGRHKLGLVATLVLGMVGSVIGGTLANLFGAGTVFELNLVGTIFAVIAAVLVLGIAEGRPGR